MYNKETILACAESLVGFREDSNAIYDSLSEELTVSTSGLYVNDLSSVNFEIIAANLSNDIDADTYLTNVFESELFSIINKFILRSKQLYNSKELLSKQTIVTGVASMNDRVTKNARFVGYAFSPRESNYLKTEIIQLGFQATETQITPLKIYLYETSQLEPITTFDFEITKKYSLTWQSVTDFIISYQSTTGGSGQNYLIGYYESDPNNPKDYQLQNQALRLDFDCGCSGSPKKIWGKYINIQPIAIPNSELNFDVDSDEYYIPLVDNVYDYVQSNIFGLNAKINVTCDVSDVICQNIQLFAPALQHAMATRILYDAYSSTRINSISDSKREQVKQFAVKYDGILNGYTTPDGIKIKGIVDTLTIDFSALDNYCLPCKPGIEKMTLTR